jgi:hypothetical protein
VIFPMLCMLKGFAAIALIYWMFPAEVESLATPVAREPMSAEEKRLTIILIVAIVLLRATDFARSIHAGWWHSRRPSLACCRASACCHAARSTSAPRFGIFSTSAAPSGWAR